MTGDRLAKRCVKTKSMDSEFYNIFALGHRMKKWTNTLKLCIVTGKFVTRPISKFVL